MLSLLTTPQTYQTGQKMTLSASKVWWLELSQLSLCSEFNKENSMEFSLNSLLLIHFTTVAMHLLSHGPHVTLVMWHSVMWPYVTLWQSHVILSHALSCSYKSNKKRKEKKRNINNDLAILPSHDRLGGHLVPGKGNCLSSARKLLLYLGSAILTTLKLLQIILLFPSIPMPVHALVDSGSSNCFVDSLFMSKYCLSVWEINPLLLILIDGSINHVVNCIISLPINFSCFYSC